MFLESTKFYLFFNIKTSPGNKFTLCDFGNLKL